MEEQLLIALLGVH